MQKDKRTKEPKLLINIEQKQPDTWFLREKEAKERWGRRRVEVEKGGTREVGLNKKGKKRKKQMNDI